MENKKALIIDRNIDYCFMMANFLSRKSFDTYYTDTIEEGLEIIETKRPELILADKSLLGLKEALEFIINETDNYDPQVR